MKIWDRGTYELHKFRDDEVMVTFHGERVHGRYVLFRTRGKDWMIHRMDPPEDPGPRADARADRADARHAPARSRARTGAGRTRSSGTACARSATSRAAGCGWPAAHGRDITPRYPELRELGPRARRRARRCSTARWSRFDAGRAAELPAPAEPHAPDLRARRAPAGRARAGDLHRSSTCSSSTGTRCWPARTSSAASALLALGLDGPRAGRRPRTTSATARRCSRPRARRGSRASSPSGSTARTRRGGARRSWIKVKNVRRDRRGRSAAGCRGRATAPAGSARCSSATTRTASCATPAASARASTRPS